MADPAPAPSEPVAPAADDGAASTPVEEPADPNPGPAPSAFPAPDSNPEPEQPEAPAGPVQQ